MLRSSLKCWAHRWWKQSSLRASFSSTLSPGKNYQFRTNWSPSQWKDAVNLNRARWSSSDLCQIFVRSSWEILGHVFPIGLPLLLCTPVIPSKNAVTLSTCVWDRWFISCILWWCRCSTDLEWECECEHTKLCFGLGASWSRASGQACRWWRQTGWHLACRQ